MLEETGCCSSSSARVEGSETSSSVAGSSGEPGAANHARERSRLWSNRDPNCSGNSNLHIALTDPSHSGQHDLHYPNGSSPAPREKATLSSFLSSLQQRLPVFVMYPYTSGAEQADHQQQRLRRGDDPLASNHSAGEPSALFETAPNPETLMGEHSQSVQSGNVRTAPSTSALRRNRSRASPFCPCFSPTMSNSDTDDEDVPEHVGRHWSSSVAEVLRQRLAIVGEAANQLAGPTVSRRMLLNDEAPAVHRIVEYSHHLVPDIDRILNSSYYWGVMDRFKAEELLDGKPEGTFLLRDSAQTEYLFSVSFRRYQRTLHARIEQGNHRFSFDIHDESVYSAPTITELIEKYKDPARCLFFEPQLTYPLSRRHVFTLQELCRGVIVSRTTYNGVSSLRLPPKLKHYLRQYHYTIPVRTLNLQE